MVNPYCAQHQFFLPVQQSPTYYNLNYYLIERGWQSSSCAADADFSDNHFCFHQQAAECLEFKHLLAQLVAQYCPTVMPKTYVINDYTWPVVLNQLTHDYYSHCAQVNKTIDNPAWILKPSLLNNGQAIAIFPSISSLENHFMNSKRLGGEHVLQYYLQPHLLRDNRKYSLRQFLILTNYMGNYLYYDGYFNVARYPFQAEQFSDLRCHLTNEHLSGHKANVIQIPSHRFAHYPDLYAQIRTMMQALIAGLRQHYPDAFSALVPRLAIFGVDFMVDSSGRVWLLEANHGPCFPIDDNHPLQSYLYRDFWQRFIDYFVLPIAEPRMPVTRSNAFFTAI